MGITYLSCGNKIISCGNKILYWGNKKNVFHESATVQLCGAIVWFCFIFSGSYNTWKAILVYVIC
jgi:hypothetical protein